MDTASLAVTGQAERLAAKKARCAEIRSRARRLFDGGATGVQVSAAISNATDELILDFLDERLTALTKNQQEFVGRNSALVAVGGSGRGELAPWSDADLLFLHRPTNSSPFTLCASHVVRDLWDAGIKLGHSIRNPGDTISLSRHEPEVATALVESRLLWGDAGLFEQFMRKFRKRAVRGRLRAFVDDCICAREQERADFGSTHSSLEPDVKRSSGGLRDVHLIRWLGYAYYGAADIESIRLQGGLRKGDARRLNAAHEYLTRIRIDMHFEAGQPSDLLSKEEQLRIAHKRGIDDTANQRSVERLMQEYFRRSGEIANVCERFVALHRPRRKRSRFISFLMTHRSDGILKVGPDTISVHPRHHDAVCGNLESILKLHRSALLYGVDIAPELLESLKQAAKQLDATVSRESGELFRDLLARTGNLGRVLRIMYETGLLEILVPDMSHARSLLQFNQYHSYTVDEHTLRAVEAAEAFEHDSGPLGTAYRAIRHKELLHLALLLHDLGKGLEGDHSEIGEQIALRITKRLDMPEYQQEIVALLVRQHLKMTHLALRRDISDPQTIIELSRAAGSPETLRMLYVLTAADLSAVGPDVWNDWKAGLLTGLYDRAMRALSGKPFLHNEKERLQRIRDQVQAAIVPLDSPTDGKDMSQWVREQLEAFPPHYLSATPPEKIASDIDTIEGLVPEIIVVDGEYDRQTGTVEYRLIAYEDQVANCFHRMTGALTAKRLEILGAQISTSSNGVVVDRFRVVDSDHTDDVPRERIEEVAQAVRDALTGKVAVPDLFQRHRRFNSSQDFDDVSNLPLRIGLDNDSSERATIVDVFAYDRPGLLYTIARTLFQLGVSVEFAKIATHLDQVADAFYVTNEDGEKIKDGAEIRRIRDELTEVITDFMAQGHAKFGR